MLCLRAQRQPGGYPMSSSRAGPALDGINLCGHLEEIVDQSAAPGDVLPALAHFLLSLVEQDERSGHLRGRDRESEEQLPR